MSTTLILNSVKQEMQEKIDAQKVYIAQFDRQIADEKRPKELRENDEAYRDKFKYRLELYEKMLRAI